MIDSNIMETSSQNEILVPKPVIGSRLSSELYQSFINYFSDESPRMPSKSLLVREMSQTMNSRAKKTNNTVRKKFRNWTKRMALSNGVLLHKPTNKIIIPEMDFHKTIEEIHKSSAQHLNVTQTVRQIKSRFTWTTKNFGIDFSDVLNTLSECQNKKCQKSVRINKKRLKNRDSKLSQTPEISKLFDTQSRSEDNSVTSKYFFGNNQNIDSKTYLSEDCNQLFDELVFKIHLMRIHINLFKVHKFRRHPSLRESE